MVHVHPKILLAGASFAVLAGVASPSVAEETFAGVPALAGVPARISGNLSVRDIGPLARDFEITLSDLATGRALVDYEEELTQELHVIAVDSALSTFVHEHAERPDAGGRFSVRVDFPKPTLYHVYADAVPTGLGRQVLRFDVPVGEAAAGSVRQEPQGGLATEGSDGPYTVELDAPGLKAGKEAEVKIRILKNGRPAQDLTPYLGVSAHAVFIAASDLAYVHAHATAEDHDAHAGHGVATTEKVPPELILHVTAPRAGVYALWIQFTGGGEIRTVPFRIEVWDAGS
jgi:hypothetical protein